MLTIKLLQKTQNASCKEKLQSSLHNKITRARKVSATVSISQTMKQVTHFLISKLTIDLKKQFLIQVANTLIDQAC